MVDETKGIAYGNDENKKLYPGTNKYPLEKNAILTERELNYVAKDIRDYIDEKGNDYVAYYDQLPRTDEQQELARNNIEAMGPGDKIQIYNYINELQGKYNSLTSTPNLDLAKSAQDLMGIKEIIDSGANICFLSDSATVDSDGNIPIVAEYFLNVPTREFFYKNTNYFPFQERLDWDSSPSSILHPANYESLLTIYNEDEDDTSHDSRTVGNYTYKKSEWSTFNVDNTTYVSPACLPALLWSFGAYTNTSRHAQATTSQYGIGAGVSDSAIDENLKSLCQFDTSSLLAFSQQYEMAYNNFIPKQLQSLKEGDLLYQQSTGRVYKITKTPFSTITLVNSSGTQTLYQVESQKRYPKMDALYPDAPTLEDYKDLDGIDNYKNFYNYQNDRFLYILSQEQLKNNFPVIYRQYSAGAMAFHCELLGTLPNWTLWQYNGKVILGGGEECLGAEYLRKLSYLGGTQRKTAWVGDYVYNPYSQSISRIIRGYCPSETVDASTYLIEPVPTFAPLHMDGVFSAEGGASTKGFGWKIYTTPVDETEFSNGITTYFNTNRNIFAQIGITDANTVKERYYDHELTEQFDIQGSTNRITIHGKKKPGNLDIYEFNAFFLLPPYVRETMRDSTGDPSRYMNGSRYAQMCCCQEGDLIFDNGYIFQVVRRPYLKDLMYKEDDYDEAESFRTWYEETGRDLSNDKWDMLYDILKNVNNGNGYSLDSDKDYNQNEQVIAYRQLLGADRYDKDLYYRLISLIQRPIIVDAIRISDFDFYSLIEGTTIEGLADIQRQIDQIKGTGATTPKTLVELTDSINDAWVDINQNTSNIENLNTDVDSIERQIDQKIKGSGPIEPKTLVELTDDVDNIQDDINSIQVKVNQNAADIRSLDEDVGNNTQDIDILSQNVTENYLTKVAYNILHPSFLVEYINNDWYITHYSTGIESNASLFNYLTSILNNYSIELHCQLQDTSNSSKRYMLFLNNYYYSLGDTGAQFNFSTIDQSITLQLQITTSSYLITVTGI